MRTTAQPYVFHPSLPRCWEGQLAGGTGGAGPGAPVEPRGRQAAGTAWWRHAAPSWSLSPTERLLCVAIAVQCLSRSGDLQLLCTQKVLVKSCPGQVRGLAHARSQECPSAPCTASLLRVEGTQPWGGMGRSAALGRPALRCQPLQPLTRRRSLDLPEPPFSHLLNGTTTSAQPVSRGRREESTRSTARAAPPAALSPACHWGHGIGDA